ncbi:hypothetical protein ACOMHN_050717 [Nucella lapillus]
MAEYPGAVSDLILIFLGGVRGWPSSINGYEAMPPSGQTTRAVCRAGRRPSTAMKPCRHQDKPHVLSAGLAVVHQRL